MQFDDLLRTTGEYGRYQKLKINLTFAVGVTTTWVAYNMIFVTRVVEHHCQLPIVNDSEVFVNISEDDLLNLFIPQDDSCHMYQQRDVEKLMVTMNYNISEVLDNVNTLQKFPCQYGWEYPGRRKTIVSEYDLVCDKTWLVAAAQAVFFLGQLFGAVLFSQIFADKFGRRFSFLLSVNIMVASGCATVFAVNLSIFMLLYFIQGFGQISSFLCIFRLFMELIGPTARTKVGFVVYTSFGLGFFALSVMAYLIEDWQHLELALSIPWVIYAAYWWLIPESPKFFLMQRRFYDAEKVILKIAYGNNMKPPPHLYTKLEEIANEDAKPKSYAMYDLLRTWRFSKHYLNIWLNLFVNSLIYYGLVLYSVDLGENPFINVILFGLIEIPAYLSCFYLSSHLRPFSFCMITGGVACIIGSLLSQSVSWFSVSLFIIAKLVIAASHGIINLICIEFFPPVVHSVALACCTIATRLGGIFIPFILHIRHSAEPIPLLFLGFAGVICGGLAFHLPENGEMPMPKSLSLEYSSSFERTPERDFEEDYAFSGTPAYISRPDILY